MADTTQYTTIVVVDDELYNLTWMIDYLKNRGFDVVPARNANEAVEMLEDEIYRCMIIDLNIPIFNPLIDVVSNLGDVYGRYPGLFVAREARSRGYRDRQVIIYSVHRDPEVSEQAHKLGCTYILKGRPIEMKSELEDVLAYDPTSQ